MCHLICHATCTRIFYHLHILLWGIVKTTANLMTSPSVALVWSSSVIFQSGCCPNMRKAVLIGFECQLPKTSLPPSLKFSTTVLKFSTTVLSPQGLLQTTYKHRVTAWEREWENIMVWTGTTKGVFPMCSSNWQLVGGADVDLTWKGIGYYTKTPPKVAFFVWTISCKCVLIA